MSGYKTDQRHVHHRGREFHFVSYEGQLENAKRGETATPPTWFLMASGKRWAVAPQVSGQEPPELDDLLIRWLDENVFAVEDAPVAARRKRPPRRAR